MSTLIFSVSGLRGIVGNGLTPDSILKYTSAFAEFCGKGKIVIGRDARISGEMVKQIVTGTLLAKGNDVIDLGICPTPTVLFNVSKLNAAGGIVITASHNPNEWNALKLLNSRGEFLTPDEYNEMKKNLELDSDSYNLWNKLGSIQKYSEGLSEHINAVLSAKHIDADAIQKRKFRVLLDCVNGAGVYSMPILLTKLGCEVVKLNCEQTGIFPRLPEPIPENLTETFKAVKSSDVDLGIVVDPDVDRLVLVTEQGEPFNEENTVTQAVKFVLSKEKGIVAVNLSTTRAVDDVAAEYGCNVFRSPVGEANVVKKMKEVNAVIGGEGSGGVIYPALQYGRDALMGTAITLQHLLEFGKPISELKKSLPQYFIAKDKIEVADDRKANILESLMKEFSSGKITTEDGLRIDFEDHWVHMRMSNTEPVIRCIIESNSAEKSKELLNKYLERIKQVSK